VGKDYSARPLRSTDAEAVVADIHLHSPDYRDKAVSEFQNVLKEDPNSAAACRGLGYAYLQQRNMHEAGEYFKRAAQADSKDPRVHYYSALLADRQGVFADQSKLTEMIRELEAAISLDPNFADAYSLMAFARMRAGDNAEAVKMAEKAVSLSPRNENYKFNLAQIYLSSQEKDKAIPLMQRLQKSNEQQIAFRAGQLLNTVQAFQEAQSATQAVQSPGNFVPKKVIAERAALPGSVEEEDTRMATAQEPPKPTEIKFLKGTIVRADCSSQPSGVLEVSSAGKTWEMRVPDIKHTIVLGATRSLLQLLTVVHITVLAPSRSGLS
jgi:tetratricopeptide (TPR) repeat protein